MLRIISSRSHSPINEFNKKNQKQQKKYFIYYHKTVTAARNAATIEAWLMVNDRVILHAVAEGTKSSHDLQGGNIAVLKISKGDKVWISGTGTLPGDSGGTSGRRTSSFSGFLVQPTGD